jgi:catechol 2,3-dioxygenase-like lactoylglutathione lyase family enzyme
VYRFEGAKLASEHVYLDEGRLRHQLTKAEGRRPFASSRDVILRTERFDAAVAFYEGVLGLAVALRQGALVGFETGSFQLFVERGAPEHAPVFEMHVDDVAAAAARLVAAGCAVVEEDPRVPRCYVRDPFGFVFNLARR